MNDSSKIIWFTGMSGVGKSFYSKYLEKKLRKNGYNVNILDGDTIRSKYNIPVGFSYDEICKNNLFISEICQKEFLNFDITIVSVISPYEEIRKLIRNIFKENLFFIYIFASIASLKERDTKGLYKRADNNEILNLIGYSKDSIYEIPKEPDLILDTSSKYKPKSNYKLLDNFLIEYIYKNKEKQN